MADETGDKEAQLSFKVKTGKDGLYNITIAETATVLDLKTKLSGDEYAKVPAGRQRLIYSGRVLKDGDVLKEYKIKDGNTLHMVESAQSNLSQNPATPNAGVPRPAAGVPTNMAAGASAGNPLVGLTGARYAGHANLPGIDMFGADGGMGAPPTAEATAAMLDDPNMQQMMNEALQNPQMIDMIIQSTPHLRNNPMARQMLNSPEFRRMMTDPASLRQAAAMQRMMGGMPGMPGMPGGAGAGGFPAPGVTDTTPAGAAGTTPGQNNTTQDSLASMLGEGYNPFATGPGAAAANPFAAMFPSGQTPGQTPPAPASAGQAIPSQTGTPGADAVNPFASLFPGAGGPGGVFGNIPPPTPEQLQQFQQMLGGGGFGGGFGAPTSPPPPADTRPPEERYADQLRQLNDMGFFDFDRNIEALRRSGGSVQGAINQLLG